MLLICSNSRNFLQISAISAERQSFCRKNSFCRKAETDDFLSAETESVYSETLPEKQTLSVDHCLRHADAAVSRSVDDLLSAAAASAKPVMPFHAAAASASSKSVKFFLPDYSRNFFPGNPAAAAAFATAFYYPTVPYCYLASTAVYTNSSPYAAVPSTGEGGRSPLIFQRDREVWRNKIAPFAISLYLSTPIFV